MTHLQTFVSRHSRLGPLLWALSLQYFIVQIIAAQAWAPPYSWLHNTISDLGNTACGQYGDRIVCSPDHTLMNISFVLLGATMFLGALLLLQTVRSSHPAVVGFGCLMLAGLGTGAVGLFPENTIGWLHIGGAFLPFFIGNIGLIIVGQAPKLPTWLAMYSFGSGALALVALGFFVTQHYLWLGTGGMERITAYPQTIWLIVFGIYTYSTQVKKTSNS